MLHSSCSKSSAPHLAFASARLMALRRLVAVLPTSSQYPPKLFPTSSLFLSISFFWQWRCYVGMTVTVMVVIAMEGGGGGPSDGGGGRHGDHRCSRGGQFGTVVERMALVPPPCPPPLPLFSRSGRPALPGPTGRSPIPSRPPHRLQPPAYHPLPG